MNILIAIISFVLGFASCIVFVRIVVRESKREKAFKEAEQIVNRDKRRIALSKNKGGKVIKVVLVKDENIKNTEEDSDYEEIENKEDNEDEED